MDTYKKRLLVLLFAVAYVMWTDPIHIMLDDLLVMSICSGYVFYTSLRGNVSSYQSHKLFHTVSIIIGWFAAVMFYISPANHGIWGILFIMIMGIITCVLAILMYITIMNEKHLREQKQVNDGEV